MNPYEKTASEMKRQAEAPKRAAKTAANIGIAAGTAVGAASFAPILARAAPFLSQYIPEGLAIQGLSKINPKMGDFIKSAMSGGYDFQEVKDFIGDQITQSENDQEQPKEDRNIVQQYSDNLHQYVSGLIKNGKTPLEAAAASKKFLDKKEQDLIKKIEKDHKTDWASILETIYGGGQATQPQQQQPQQSFQQQSEEPIPMQQLGQGQAKQQLMQAMQALSQKLRT